MRLKSIEMLGFKSFPDRTVLNFEHGVTVVVGPNGSGKSNISDAIRWVLGELSSKNMRGSKMEDVIFGGSASRKAMGYTQVTLTIDNASEYEDRLPVDFEEVEVTRRYYRTGESEYLINRKPVRLKDIYELFMNTGIGKTGYSLIGQGKAAEIISQKSTERRTIFEEAAGISKYRFKKAESERKLEQTQANLDRVSDLLSDLETRVGPLEKEAEKAKKYLEVFETKKRADVSLWLYDVKATHDDLEKTEAETEVAARELEIAEDEAKSLETENERLFADLQSGKSSLASSESELRRLEEKKHELESSALLAEQEAEHLSAQKESFRIQLEEKKQSLERAEGTLGEKRKKLAEEKQAAEKLDTDFVKADSEKEQRQLDLYESEKEEKSIDLSVGELEEAVVGKKLLLSSLSGATDDRQERAASLLKEKAEREKNVALLADRVEKSEKTVGEYRAKIEESKKEIEKAEQKTAASLSALQKAQAEKDKLFLEMESRKEKVSALRRMEELFEGYSQSVRIVMKAAENGSVSGILGPVSHLISVDKKYRTAIETALGGNLQNVVCRDEDAAKDAIRYLKDTGAGRATFYPITAMKPNPIRPDRSVLSAPGYLAVAYELISYSDEVSPVMEYLLGKTLVFDTLDNASSFAKEKGYTTHIVTLDGQFIHAGGSYTGGSVGRGSGILSRREEITGIEKEISSLREKYSEKERELEEQKKINGQTEAEIKKKNDVISFASSLLNAEETQKKVLETQIASDTEELNRIEEELAGLNKAEEDKAARILEIESEITEIEGRIGEKKNEKEKISARSAALKEEIDQKIDEISSLRILIAEKRKDVSVLENGIAELSEEIAVLREKIDSETERLGGIGGRVEQNVNKAAKNRDELKETTSALEETVKRCNSLHVTVDGIEAKINRLREDAKGVAGKKELAYRRHLQLQGKLDRLRAESERMSVHIEEEYDLNYSSAKELGYPPVTKETRSAVVSALSEAKNKLKAIGNVNLGAIDEYREVKEKYDFMKKQSDDLKESRESLVEIISKMEREMKALFVDTFENINRHFSEVFRELFGGGTAEVRLEDPGNVLESGIEIRVAPPGKIIKNLVQLSGGEQTFVSIALFFAILKVNPTPFCLFDEIESALDEVNVQRFADYIKNYTGQTQFILISHRRGTIERADTLYGVTMFEKGVSKVLTLDVNEVEKQTGVSVN